MSSHNVAASSLTEASTAIIFLRLDAVVARIGLARSSIYQMISTGDFPKPIKLSPGRVAWPEREIVAWQKARIAARDAKILERDLLRETGGIE